MALAPGLKKDAEKLIAEFGRSVTVRVYGDAEKVAGGGSLSDRPETDIETKAVVDRFKPFESFGSSILTTDTKLIISAADVPNLRPGDEVFLGDPDAMPKVEKLTIVAPMPTEVEGVTIIWEAQARG